jgi:hypothetical protein
VSTWTIERDTKVEAKGGKNRTSSKEIIKKLTRTRAREEKLLVCALHFSFYGITKCRGRLSAPKLDNGGVGPSLSSPSSVLIVNKSLTIQTPFRIRHKLF